MQSLSNRLNTEGDVPSLREPDDLNTPNPAHAPFELESARPLSQTLGDYLTEPSWAGEDANPDIVLQHIRNQELTVWIARFDTATDPAYVLTCWDADIRFHFDVSRETLVSVLEQASASPIWLFKISDNDLLETLVNNL